MMCEFIKTQVSGGKLGDTVVFLSINFRAMLVETTGA